MTTDQIVLAHERRIAELDPLLPGTHPLSAPFWHRCGYRPLWTSWRVRPAARLGLMTA